MVVIIIPSRIGCRQPPISVESPRPSHLYILSRDRKKRLQLQADLTLTFPWIRASASWSAGCVPWCHLGCILGPAQPIKVVESVGGTHESAFESGNCFFESTKVHADLDSASPRTRSHSSDASLTVMSANLNSRLFLEGVESRAQPHQGGFLPSPRGHLQQGSRSDLSTGKARTDCGHSSGRALSLELRTCHLSSSCGSQMCLGHLHVASCSQTCHFSHIPASLLVPTPERAALMVMLARTHRVILC